MGRRDPYEGDAPSGPGGAFKMMSLLGHSRHQSSGTVGFFIKSLSVSACSSVVFGISSYMCLSWALGPVLPFLGGSAFGFVGGLVHRYRVDLDEARLMTVRYPRVIEHHVRQVEPMELTSTPGGFEAWLAGVPGSLKRQGVLVAALYSAADTISKLQDEEEERILEESYRGREAAAAAADE
ncbi:hypothetical protein CHLRE_14g609600v5 [Chlamydomonas reinhardtii]|uniref:Uncharacterized protein n=1 Tax=Chlamydomonas reinhardtii TaxID=3055 RepID=A0A2K3CX50_CHLRE|nr:uncharacterized protein CHLRE_14g609600v5 [Chlamydomonas reinhardtii]PNW72867.1 hypothetical protein CHLRE_14g609600v5 [Chlamydomonas reinhardtii]